ncbi:MAG: PilC/PilY family type IV pilus protein [Pseudomonadota bacterium]|nr:PilC/PilY family type IV pilus protein [Pseudomonadota bacterium]
MNINGTGQVKPNLMLLYDNSGSMGYTFTPDYIDDTNTCRSRLLMSSGTQSCAMGHPPFNSPDFNRQYYNPKVRYLPPVKDNGIYYPSQTSGNTTAWTSVTTDAFGKNKSNLLGNGTDTTNLVNNVPDRKWCNEVKDRNNRSVAGTNCVFNSATYSYPNDTSYMSVTFGTNPYYYNINVAEYCTDATLKSCTSTAVGAAAPAGFPIPAKVRWCDSRALTNCQAKYVGAYVYPRFSSPNSDVIGAYGTLTIGATAGANAVSVSSVSVIESGTAVVITDRSVPAGTGTNSPTKQASLANDVAASIIAKTGLTNQYTACVRAPTTTSVPNCATAFGITLGANNIVAIVPLDCTPGATSKNLGQCSLLADGTRDGWAVAATSPAAVVTPAKGATTVLTVSGTGKNSSTSRTTLASLQLGGAPIMGSLKFAANVSSADGAAAIAAAISATGVTAVQGNRTGCPGSTSTVCITTTANLAAGQAVTIGAITNNGSMAFTADGTTAGTAATYDTVPMTPAPIGAGSAVFVRVDIVPSRTSYPKDTNRTDCTAATCSYDDEMTNFANWYAYYKTRNQMMKTAVGQAFNPISGSFSVGIASLSSAAEEGDLTRPRPFTGTDRTTWYNALYNMTGNDSTPLRPALHSIGKMYANLGNYVQDANDEVVKFPCQQNFTFLTTDGYWNGGEADDVVNNDNVQSAARFCLSKDGCVDTRAQSGNSLADVALYWYNGGSNTTGGSLRPSLEDMTKPGLVLPVDENTHLHMNTYTLGLGVDGIMNYEEHYDTSPIPGGDFSKLINGATTGCPWNNNGPYVWPDPATDDTRSSTVQSRVDDLWHAAINGHGKYFSASDPTQVVTGLQSALSNIAARVGAAASASTSSPNISQADNDIFSVSFTTVKWNGVITDRKIDVVTGAILPTEIWTSSDMIGRKVDQSSDSRLIKMLVPAAAPAAATLKDFSYANMTGTEKAWFDNQCMALAQCTSLSLDNRAIVNNGANIVNWLRGQQQYANGALLRAYSQTAGVPQGLATTIPIVLGDIGSSKPAYVRDPRRGFTTAGYSDYKTAKAARAAMVYVAANDGMLHALDAATGEERWAYAPRITMKKLPVQASTGYGTNHQYTTDGSPEVSDVQINGVWKTVLVAGLNGGGRGFYAVDVTDPLVPVAMWETCADAAICSGVNNEPEMGLSFGNPLMAMWKPSSAAPAQWVVFLTSGYNNVPGSDGVAGAGTGKGWLMIVDIATGAVLSKVSTGSGDTTTPSGFTRITGISANPVTDPLITFIYGGDNLGQMWRFDLTGGGTPAVVRMGNAGPLQPITSRPDITLCAVTSTVAGITSTSNKMVVAYGTGRLLDVSDVANTDVQGVYVVSDKPAGIGATMTPTEWRATMAKENLLKATTSGSTQMTISGPVVDLSTQQGWFTDLNQTAGERVNLDVKIVSGLLNVVTNIPSASSACSVGGSANLYSFDVCKSVGDPANGGVVGKPLSPNSALVGYVIVSLPNGVKELIGTDAGGLLHTPPLPDPDGAKSRRSGWRRIQN